MNRRIRNHTVDLLFVITLFLIFAISVIMLTGAGSSVYRSIVEDMDENYNERASYSYIASKLHQNDMSKVISVGTFAGNEAILISEEINNVKYCTYLYNYEGKMKELFTRYGQDIDPEYGTDIIDVKTFEIEMITDSLYCFSIEPVKGEPTVLYVNVRSQ